MNARILVIRLGALGDMVLSFGPFAAIRDAHPEAQITLLTAAPYDDFMTDSPYFDKVWTDQRPKITQLRSWLALRHRLRAGHFDMVYDLQTSDRSNWYYRLMGRISPPAWSGIAPGCSHPHRNPDRDNMHTIDRQAEQLRHAGIDPIPPADLSWLTADIDRYGLAARYALLVPGVAAHRPEKRWPADYFGALARNVAAKGIEPAILGGEQERDIAQAIRSACSAARDLTGETDFKDIAALARNAAGAVGNDTGPMHLIAAAGCPALVLFSAESDPLLTQPRGPAVSTLRSKNLADLSVADVAAALSLR
ncbi:MAG: glycosyltransferase family 9 protein [Pseudomonadota bacterium]|nr:glycosyltransferase family 9 protein [Pseudomonadota bacterium]